MEIPSGGTTTYSFPLCLRCCIICCWKRRRSRVAVATPPPPTPEPEGPRAAKRREPHLLEWEGATSTAEEEGIARSSPTSLLPLEVVAVVVVERRRLWRWSCRRETSSVSEDMSPTPPLLPLSSILERNPFEAAFEILR